ncbi:AzlC family ABC transporter permease [Kitasatospora sp. NPDC001539]|uniref:AzlC family ABC transporter permease n=1 Tax=Kitasatospora sp. NPDC001539 TaxID=3154384 RepID=UPI0033218276
MERATLRDIALVCLADALVGASFGAISISGGLPIWVPIALSVLVFAGGSQFAAVGVVLSGGGALAAVATGLVLNARMLPFGFAVGDVLRGPWWQRLLGAHLLTDETAAFALQQHEPRRRRAVYWICGVGLFVVWNLAVALGALAGGLIGDTDAVGLDAAFPAVLLALVLPSLTDRRTRTAALVGAVVAVGATPYLPAGLPVLLALVGLLFAGRPGAGDASSGAAGTTGTSAEGAGGAATADTATAADSATAAGGAVTAVGAAKGEVR